MAKRFITPFAEVGDRAAVSDTPTGTDVNYQTGYPAEYEADPLIDPAAKFVERDKNNQIYNDITANIKEWQEHVYPSFIEAVDNGGVAFPYKNGSIVTYLSIDYISLEDNNEDIPPSLKWGLYSPISTGYDHNLLGNRGEIGAHDQIYRRITTVAEVASGVFSDGDFISISDRGYAPFDVVSGGVVNGTSILDAGGGNTAENVSFGIIDNRAFGSPVTGPLNIAGGALRIVPQAMGVDNTLILIDDSQHDPINITSVEINITQLIANHSQPAGSAVVGSMLAAPDEEMIKIGLQIGGSIAADKSIFTFSKPHDFIYDWETDTVIDPFMDVAQRYVVLDNTTHITLTHPTSHGYTRCITPIDDTGPDATYIFFTDKKTDLYPYKNDVTLQILYNGSTYELHHANPVIDADLASIGFSVSESAGVFTITHPSSRRDNAAPTASAGRTITADYYSVLAQPDNTTPKTKTIAICPDLDTAGGFHTFASGEYFFVTLREILWKYGTSSINLGVVEVSPTLDFKDTETGNNIWLLGNHWATK